jgi:hypothetical protein
MPNNFQNNIGKDIDSIIWCAYQATSRIICGSQVTIIGKPKKAI